MENLQKNSEINQKERFTFEKFVQIGWTVSELLLFVSVFLYAVQPVVVLCGKLFSLPFTAFGVFYTSSIFAIIGVASRLAIFLCVNCSKEKFKSIDKTKIKDFFLAKWEVFLLLLALVWTLISCLVAQNQQIVWNGNWYNQEGFWAVVKYGVLFLDAYLIKSKLLKKLFCHLLVLSATLMGAILLYTNVQGEEFYFHFTRSVYKNSNHYGYALAVSTVMSVGLFLTQKNLGVKILYLLCFGVLHSNMLVSDCFGSLIGEVVGLVVLFGFMLAKKKKKELLILALCVVLVFACTTIILENNGITSVLQDLVNLAQDTENIIQGDASGDEGSGRFELWVETIKLIFKVPFFGKGLDCYYGNDYVNGTLDMPHNEFLQIASNVGIPVLLIYLVVLGGIYTRAIKDRKALSNESTICLSAGIGYLVSALFGNTFLYTYPFLLILLALGMQKKRRK